LAAVEKKLRDEAAVDEDGFEVVGAVNDRKTRRHMAALRDNEPSDDGFKIVRNDKRANPFERM